ncbi:hypothetical protein SAMN05216251_13012 [Actinacidiphila alni]|uniref:LPXTG cell wall anchor domain-containing protein n=1 Tax=Actinacidiphila alni TaxID=380248 RepID=A0A1I2LUW6_9ACTN|nr:hypothetical protein [Actinacidiphila alni]SFF80876.1 hypothetical protein SAMN05216251_13012 [Actinacidiphila alni]
MTSPRPYVAAAAAAALGALFFVPSASASPDDAVSSAKTAAHASAAVTSTAAHADNGGEHVGLADTGSIDTKPYVIGGAAFLVAGAGLVVNASRRARQSL